MEGLGEVVAVTTEQTGLRERQSGLRATLRASHVMEHSGHGLLCFLLRKQRKKRKLNGEEEGGKRREAEENFADIKPKEISI